jgi:hypothetical protein
MTASHKVPPELAFESLGQGAVLFLDARRQMISESVEKITLAFQVIFPTLAIN